MFQVECDNCHKLVDTTALNYIHGKGLCPECAVKELDQAERDEQECELCKIHIVDD